MIFAILTLLAALALAAVAGWFSIIGIMSIYAGAATHALIMGAVLEAGKLVTTSWLYRNWSYASWRLTIPLVIFTLTLMLSTSIGVFGFLSKSHLEQGASTIDNSAKIERLDQEISREKSTIDDDNKVIQQLDATVNSYIGKDRTDKSVSIRKSQASQRKQLRDDIDSSQKRIDEFSDEKLKLTSEVRKLQLDVGPIRYIAELIYGVDNTDKNIESAVRMFTLIIVSTLDPLAVILLIAANHTLLRRQNEKEEIDKFSSTSEAPFHTESPDETFIKTDITDRGNTDISNEKQENTEIHKEVLQDTINLDDTILPSEIKGLDINPKAGIISAAIDRLSKTKEMPNNPTEKSILDENRVLSKEEIKTRGPWAFQQSRLTELMGSYPHFIPMKVNTDNSIESLQKENKTLDKIYIDADNTYPKSLGWLGNFRRN